MNLLADEKNWRFAVGIGLAVAWAAFSFSSTIMEIALGFSMVAWLGWKWRLRTAAPALLPAPVWIPLALFAAVSIFSIVWSDFPDRSFRGILKVIQHVWIFWIVIDCFRTVRNFRFFENVVLAVAWMTMLNAFWQLFSGTDLLRGFKPEPSSAGLRVSGSFKTYGFLAAYLMLTIPYLASLAWARWMKGRERLRAVLFGLAAAGSTVLLFLTRSRGAYVALVAGFVFWLLLRRKFLILAALGLLLAGGIWMLPRGMIIHLDAEGREQSLVERCYLWDRAVQVIYAKPWTGTGINTYAVAHDRYDQRQNWRVRGYYAHNGYLQTAAEIGVPGLMALLIFLAAYGVASGKRAAGHPEDARVISEGLLTGLASFLVFVASDTVMHNDLPVLTFWYILGLQWAWTAYGPRECP